MKELEKIINKLSKRVSVLKENDENYEDKLWLIHLAEKHLQEVQGLIEKAEKIPTRIYKEVKIETTFENTDYLLVVYVYENEKYARMQRLLSYETMTSVLYTEKVDALYDHCEEVIKEYIQSNYNQIYKLEL